MEGLQNNKFDSTSGAISVPTLVEALVQMTEKKVEEVVYPLKPWNFKNGWSFISIKSHDRFLIAWKLSQQARSPFFLSDPSPIIGNACH